MTFTPFEREVLRGQKRTIELLELLVMAHQPVKYQIGTMPGEQTIKADELAARVQAGQVPMEQALANAGIFPMSHRVTGQPESPEQRAERFAARAKEVGLPEEQVAEVSGRVALDLDKLTQPVTQNEVAANLEELVEEMADQQDRIFRQAGAAPAKKTPAKRAAKPSQ